MQRSGSLLASVRSRHSGGHRTRKAISWGHVGWVLFFCLQAPALIRAQDEALRVRIGGVVLNPMRQPIEGAEVRLEDGSVTTFTSTSGTFRLSVRRAKEILVRVRRPGYKSQLLRFEGDWQGEVLLVPGVYELPEVVTIGRYAKPGRYAGTQKYDDFFRRRRQGLGQFITREEIDRRAPVMVAQILEGRSGIRVSINPSAEGTTVSFARCNELPAMISIYIDGRKLAGLIDPDVGSVSVLSKRREGDSRPPGNSRVGDALERIPVSEIEMMEIFRGPGELPPEFNDGNCGAIAIWTRQGER